MHSKPGSVVQVEAKSFELGPTEICSDTLTIRDVTNDIEHSFCGRELFEQGIALQFP